MNILRYIIKRARIFTLLVVLVPIVAGVYAYNTLPKEGEPEISAPLAIVVTAYTGASPGEIESLVTNPLEEALSDLKDLKELRSSSLEGVSVVVVEFDVDADVERSLQRVREKVTDSRGDLPDDAEDPEVEEITLSDIPIMLISVVGDLDPMQLKRLTEKTADELELLPEVLSTDVAGGLTREIQIYVDPVRLNQYGLTILDVYGAVGQSDINIPGGMVNVAERRFLLRTLTEVKRVEDYAGIPIVTQGDRVVYLGDVAEIVDGHDEDLTYARVDGRSAVSITVKKRTGANILETAQKVRERLKELEQDFPPGVNTVITADQAKFIRQGFDVMNNSAVTGLIIVIIVLYFAMGLRNSIITSLSIPLSLLMTFILLKTFGLTNNNMVRFSLVLCIGLLVDNAIIVVENAYHHFQLGKDRLQAVFDGVSEIAMPVISATLTTMAAFVPLLLMTGTTGEYMSFLPKTVTIALTSSLIVALVTNPLVLSRFMKQSLKDGRVIRPEEDLRRLKKLYVVAVSWALNHRLAVVILTVLALTWVGGVLALKIVEVEMFPDIDFDYIYITIETPPGTDVDITRDVALQVEDIVRAKVPEAVQVVSTVGYKPPSAFEISVSVGNQSDFAEVTVELMDGKEYARPTHLEIQKRIRPLLDAIPGAKIRFRPLAWGPPQFAPVVVKLVGHDLDVLRGLSAQVKEVMSETPGAYDIEDDFSDAPPELRVAVDRAAAARLGVPLDSVAMGLRAATAGLVVREFRDEQDVSRKYDLKVRYTPMSRTSPDMLGQVKVRSQTGALVPLSNFASFTQGPGINAIRHIDRRRVVRTTAQNQGRSAVEVTNDLRKRLAELPVPAGYSFEFGGEYKETEESFASLKLAYLVAFLLIFTLLVAQFNSYFQPFAIMTALPLSVVGAMFGLMVTGNNFSIMSFVGLVGLTGIVVNDSIVLVDCINRFRAEGMNVFQAIVAAGQQRLRPIISTTVTTMGGIVTLTITDKLWEGLGVVIIFGIGFATVLTLVVVPVMYSLFEGLGYQVKSALRGPRHLDAPEGRSFFYTRRRYARLLVGILLLIQAAILIAGASAVGPVLFEPFYTVNLQAPSVLKLVIESVVFGLGMAFRIIGFLILFTIPGFIGLLVVMSRRTADMRFVAATPDNLTITFPAETLTIPKEKIARVKYSRMRTMVTIWVEGRRIKIRRVVEDHRTPAKTPIFKWLSQPGPPRRSVRESTRALYEVILKMAMEKLPEPTKKEDTHVRLVKAGS
jgi:multidrug efflux pump